MTEEIKPIKLEFTINLTREISTYDIRPIVKVKFEELVPVNVDPVLYAKKRIKEEMDRQKQVIASHAPAPAPVAEIDPLVASF